jgi:hypothetical protein
MRLERESGRAGLTAFGAPGIDDGDRRPEVSEMNQVYIEEDGNLF